MDFGNLFFSAYGRISRQEFWIAWVILLAVGIFAAFIPGINLLVGLGSLYCGVCVRSKRLHDMGRSGWWQIIPHVAKLVVLVVLIYFGIAALVTGLSWDMVVHSVAAAGLVAGVIAMILTFVAAGMVNLGFLLWIGISESDPYDNLYGPSRIAGDYRMGAPA